MGNLGVFHDCTEHAQVDKVSANSTRVRICAVAGAYLETDVAQASELMFGSIAVFSMRGLWAMVDGVRKGVLVAWCFVNHRTNTDR